MPTGIPFKTEEARKAGERARSRRYRQNHLEARRKSVRAATCKVRANQTPEERAAYNAQCAKYDAKKRERARTDIAFLLHLRVLQAKRRATKKDLKFNLTDDYVKALYTACPYDAFTGQAFEPGTRAGNITIDRINSKKGYIKGNVRLVRWHTNLALQNFGDAVLEAMSAAIMTKKQGKVCQTNVTHEPRITTIFDNVIELPVASL